MGKKGYLRKFGKNIAVALLAFALTGGAFLGCGDKKDSDADLENLQISIAALKGPTAIGMVGVMDSAKREETANK